MAGAADIISAGNAAQQGLGQAQEQGLELATMSEKIQSQKQALEKQKQELEDAKFNSTTGMLKTLARSNPKVARMMLPKIKDRMRNLGVPVDDAVLESYASDEEYKKRLISATSIFEKGLTPEQKAEGLASLADLMDHDKAMNMLQENDRQRAMSEREDTRLKAQEIKEERRYTESRAKEDRAEQRMLDKEARKGAAELADDFSKDGLIDAYSAVTDIEAELKKLNKGKGIFSDDDSAVEGLAGLTGVKAAKIPGTDIRIGDFNLTPTEEKIKQIVARFRNMDLKKLSGGAVTDTEATRFNEAFGQGIAKDPKLIKEGLRILTKALKAGVTNFEAKAGPEASELYRKRGGPIASRQLPGDEMVPIDPETELMAKAKQMVKASGGKLALEKALEFVKSKQGAKTGGR